MNWYVAANGLWHAADVNPQGMSVYYCSFMFSAGRGQFKASRDEPPPDAWICLDCRVSFTRSIVEGN